MNRIKKLKKYFNLVGRIITIISILFILKTIKDLNINYEILMDKFFIGISIISIGVFFGLVYLMAYGWKLILDFFSKNKNNYIQIAKVYAKSNIGKYLPGNVMHYVERNIFASKLNLKQKDIAFSSIIEIGGVAIVAAILALLFGSNEFVDIFLNIINKDNLIWLIAAFIVVVILLIIIYIKYRKQFIDSIEHLLSRRFLGELWKLFLIYSTFLCSGGIIYAIICFYLSNIPFDISIFLLLIASYVIAWVIGFIVPGAPGGIGVREFVIVFTLGSLLGKEVTLSAALIHRLLTVFGDIFAWGFTFYKRDK